MAGVMTGGSNGLMGPDEHRAFARRCRMLANGINDREAIDALLSLADEHDAKATLPPSDCGGPAIPAE